MVANEITAQPACVTARTRVKMAQACYVSKANTLDDVDFDDPGILADIRAAFAVLAQVVVENDQCSKVS